MIKGKVLRISDPKRDNVTGGRGKLQYDRVHNLYASQNIITVKENETSGTCSMKGKIRYEYNILVTKSAGKISLGRTRHRWDDTVKVDSREGGLNV
jgi:accessory colonization factor AcfC